MIATERAQLRALFVKEYRIKTKCILICIEEVGEIDKQDTLVEAASRFFAIPVDLIISRVRTREVTECKQMLIKMMKTQGHTQRVIAMKLGNIERSGIVYTLDKFDRNCRDSKVYKEKWDKFQQYCKEII